MDTAIRNAGEGGCLVGDGRYLSGRLGLAPRISLNMFVVLGLRYIFSAAAGDKSGDARIVACKPTFVGNGICFVAISTIRS